VIQELVSFVVSTFGVSRCMVASNWPVDLAMGKSTMPAMYAAIHELLASHTHEEKVALFHDNAFRVYGMDQF
jgi:predicted TIM-barrel fold metal-dependent hydrolase